MARFLAFKGSLVHDKCRLLANLSIRPFLSLISHVFAGSALIATSLQNPVRLEVMASSSTRPFNASSMQGSRSSLVYVCDCVA